MRGHLFTESGSMLNGALLLDRLAANEEVAVLSLLQLGDEGLNQFISFFNQLLVGGVQLVLFKQVDGAVSLHGQLGHSRLLLCDLRALACNDFLEVEHVLRRMLVLELLHEVLELRNARGQPLRVEEGALGGVVGHQVVLGQVEELQLVAQLLDLQVEVLHLESHGLVVSDQGSFLLVVHPDLLHEVLRRGALVRLLLAEGEALVRLDQLAFRVDDHRLELVPLPDQLLVVSIDPLLELEVLFEESVPLALAAPLTPLVFLDQAAKFAQLLRLGLQDVR